MESRMEKYQTTKPIKARSERNKRLYEEVSNIDLEYQNIDINNAIELSEKKEIRTRSEYQRRKEYETFISNKKEEPKEIEKIEQETKVHDINEILKLARENKLFDTADDKKRLLNTEYNILTKLDIEKINSKEEYSKDALKDLINSIYSSEEKNNKKEIEKDLFDDLKEKDLEISEDLSLKVLDKVPREKTELIEIIDDEEEVKEETTEDEEDVIEAIKEEKQIKQEEEKEIEEIDFEIEKRSVGTILAIIFVIVLLLGAGYILYSYFLN